MLIKPFTFSDELLPKVSNVRNRPAERGESQSEKDQKDFNER